MNPLNEFGLPGSMQTELVRERMKEVDPLFPCKPLPNVREFEVEALAPYDEYLEEQTGIKKRKFSPLIRTEPYNNKSLNRYVRRQFIRLNAARDNPRLFWIIASHLLHSSVAYRTTCITNVLPGWHRNQTYGKLWKQVHALMRLDYNNYEYKVVSIPKNEHETRSLGVPSVAWRIYLNGLNNILLVWLSVYIPSTQHGFYPGRGCGTAWKALVSTVLDSPNIKEFDLRKFFDSVNLDHLGHLLSITGIPQDLVTKIISWSRTSPRSGEVPNPWLTPLEKVYFYKYHLTGVWGFPGGISEIERYLRYLSYLSPSSPYHKKNYYVGVSQGSPISPLLSTFLLVPHLMLSSDYSNLQYADDGLVYDYNEEPRLEFAPETNISIHPGKTSLIKESGRWLRPLKFLGITYTHRSLLDPSVLVNSDNLVKDGILETATRNPKQFTLHHLDTFAERIRRDALTHHEWTLDGILLTEYKDKGHTNKPKGSSNKWTFDAWFESKYGGYLQSRLYAGTFNIKDIIQDFSYHFETWSWSDLELRRPAPKFLNGIYEKELTLNVFNSSSFASLSLAKRIKHTFKHANYRRCFTGRHRPQQ